MKKILVASLVFILLFGCAPEQSESSDTASVNQTEIQLVCQDDKEKLEKIAKAFQKKNPEIIIKTVEIDSDDDFSSSVKALLSGKNAPTLILTKAEDLSNFKEYTEDLSGEAWVNNAFANTMGEVSRAGEITAMPAEIEGIGFLYNKEIFEYANINPENINSFDRLAETAEYLAKKMDGLKKQFPDLTAVFELPDEEGERYLLNAALSQQFQNSAELLENTEELKFAEGYNSLLKLLREYGKSADITEGEVIIALKSHKSIEEGKYGILPVSVIGASQDSIVLRVPDFWVINKSAEKSQIKAAKKFLSWLYTSEEGQALVADELEALSPFDSAEKLPESPLAEDVRKFAISGKTMPYVLDGIDDETCIKLKHTAENSIPPA